MNVVFWLVVVVVLVLAWFCLSFAFKWIGSVFLHLYNDAKKEINGEGTEENEEEKEK